MDVFNLPLLADILWLPFFSLLLKIDALQVSFSSSFLFTLHTLGSQFYPFLWLQLSSIDQLLTTLYLYFLPFPCIFRALLLIGGPQSVVRSSTFSSTCFQTWPHYSSAILLYFPYHKLAAFFVFPLLSVSLTL